MKKFTLLTLSSFVFTCFIETDAQYNNNYSASFNGTNAYLTMPQTDGDMQLHDPFTIELWMKPKAYPASSKFAMLFQKANPFNGNGIYISMDEEGLVGISINNYYYTTPAPAVINFWTHIAVSYYNNTMFMYFNGSLVNQQSLSAGDIYQPYTTYIGAMFQQDSTLINFYKGEIDELRMWSVAKSVYDIDNYHHQSFTGMGSAYSTLRVSLPFNNNFNDQGGKEYNTVINNKVKFIDYTNKNTGYLSYNSSLWNNNNTLFAPDHNDLDATSGITLEYWARLLGSSVFIYKGDGAGFNYLLSFGYDAGFYYIKFNYNYDAYNFHIIKKNLADISPLSWNHIAATYKASAGNLKLYFNATLILDTVIVAGENLVPNDKPLTFLTTNGCYDEVRIWKNVVRTQAQIKADMFKGYNYTMNPLPANVTVYDFDGRMDDVMKPVADSGKSIYLPGVQNVYYQTYDYFYKASNSFAQRHTAPLLMDDKVFFVDNTKYKMSTKGLFVDLLKNTPQTITDSLFISNNGSVSDVKVFVLADVTRLANFPNDGVNELIKLTLISPSGKQVQLTPNWSSQNGYLGNSLYCIFDMSAVNKIDYDGFGVLPPFSPEIKPYQSLAGFKNKKMHGWWKLKMEIPAVLSYNTVELLGWGVYPIANTQLDATTFSDEENLSIDKNFTSAITVFPNPFTQSIHISYDLKERSNVQISLLDANGKTIVVVVNRKDDEAGKHTINFDANKLIAGIYFCRIETGNKAQTIKLVKQ